MDSGRIINSVKSRMRKSRTSGSVRVTPSNWRVYSTSKRVSFRTDYKYAIWEDYVIIYKVGNEYVEIYRVVNRYQDITRIFD